MGVGKWIGLDLHVRPVFVEYLLHCAGSVQVLGRAGAPSK